MFNAHHYSHTMYSFISNQKRKKMVNTKCHFLYKKNLTLYLSTCFSSTILSQTAKCFSLQILITTIVIDHSQRSNSKIGIGIYLDETYQRP